MSFRRSCESLIVCLISLNAGFNKGLSARDLMYLSKLVLSSCFFSWIFFSLFCLFWHKLRGTACALMAGRARERGNSELRESQVGFKRVSLIVGDEIESVLINVILPLFLARGLKPEDIFIFLFILHNRPESLYSHLTIM